MNILSNQYLIQNIALIGGIIFFAFIIAVFLTPIVGMIAKRVGAIDLPATLRKRGERGLDSRIHAYPYPKLGGLAVAGAFFLVLYATGSLISIPTGVTVGILIIIFLGVIDDIFEISAPVQFGLQFLAAFVIVASGISITSINVLNTPISFDWLPDIIFTEKFGLSLDVMEALKSKGYEFGGYRTLSRCEGILIDKDNQIYFGATDPRGYGAAVGF